MADLDPGIMQSVINSNFKTLAEQVATNVASHQQRLQLIAEASVGQILNKMNGLDPTEAVAVSAVSQSDLAKQIAQLSGAVAGIQQMMKGAQTTRPETGG
jgi:hypothetical protein